MKAKVMHLFGRCGLLRPVGCSRVPTSLFLILVALHLWEAGLPSTFGQNLLDSFDPNADGNVWAAVVQADRKIVIGGEFTHIGGTSRQHIARLNTNGTLDVTFNAGANERVLALAVQGDGKILIGGAFTTLGGGGTGTTTRRFIGRLNTNGSLDLTFNPEADDWVWALTVDDQNKILAGGNFTMLGNMSRSRLGRLMPDGSVDSAFNPGADATVRNILLQPNGMILVGGYFTRLGGGGTGMFTRNHLGRLTTTGELDGNFAASANDAVVALAIQPDDKILAGGFFTTINGQIRRGLARLSYFGNLDLSFTAEATGPGVVDDFVLQTDGKIMVAGNFTTLAGANRNHLGRLREDGTIDTSFTVGASSNLYELVSLSDDKILVLGKFTSLGGETRNRIARLGPNPNDTFANAVVINGVFETVVGSNLGAGVEAGEPVHYAGAAGKSVWWKWTAPSDMIVSLDPHGSFYGFIVAVYTNSLSGLTRVPIDPPRGLVLFEARAGTVYWIAGDGVPDQFADASGDIVLTLQAAGPAPNEILAVASELTPTAEIAASNYRSSDEHNAVWWVFHAPQDGLITVEKHGYDLWGTSPFYLSLTIYRGNSLATLVELASDYEPGVGYHSRYSFDLPVTAGQTYYMRVIGEMEAPFRFSFAYYPPPPNNDFGSRIVLDPAVLSTSSTTVGADSEPPDEPSRQSVWWSWSPNETGPVTLTTFGSECRTILAVYRNSSLSALQLVAQGVVGIVPSSGPTPSSDSSSRVTFNAIVGQTYQIMVATAGGTANEDFHLWYYETNPPGRVTVNFTKLTIQNVDSVSRTVSADNSVNFAANLSIANLQNHPTGPLRLRLFAKAGLSYREDTFYRPIEQRPYLELPEQELGVIQVGAGLSAQASVITAINGTCPPPFNGFRLGLTQVGDWGYGWGVIAVLEEQSNGIWSATDARLVLMGELPSVGSFRGGPGGGVVRFTSSFGDLGLVSTRVKVYLGPDAAIVAGAAWRVSPTHYAGLHSSSLVATNWNSTLNPYTLYVLSTDFSIELQQIPPWIAPDGSFQITNRFNDLFLTYSPCRLGFTRPNLLSIEGVDGPYRIEVSPSLTPPVWTELNNLILNGRTSLTVPTVLSNAFYRAVRDN